MGRMRFGVGPEYDRLRRRRELYRMRGGSVSAGTRFLVFQRDDFTCQYCGSRAPDVHLELDHFLAVSQGGSNDFSNLVTACYSCNIGKSAIRLPAQQNPNKRGPQ